MLQITVGSLKDIVMWVFGNKLKLVPALLEVSEVGSAAAE